MIEIQIKFVYFYWNHLGNVITTQFTNWFNTGRYCQHQVIVIKNMWIMPHILFMVKKFCLNSVKTVKKLNKKEEATLSFGPLFCPSLNLSTFPFFLSLNLSFSIKKVFKWKNLLSLLFRQIADDIKEKKRRRWWSHFCLSWFNNFFLKW